MSRSRQSAQHCRASSYRPTGQSSPLIVSCVGFMTTNFANSEETGDICAWFGGAERDWKYEEGGWR
jgi:hypothetical protein